ncbi:charon [Haematobia irritans]|uniref:charon n=1 Tax=Haematobia irritans TaxID=7368 RepID=UPI003F4F5646
MDQIKLSLGTQIKSIQIQQNGATNKATVVNAKTINVVPTRSDMGKIEPQKNIYNQRKEMLSEFRDLFSALMRIPDKELQTKILRCINAKYRSVETQTDPVEFEKESRPEHQKAIKSEQKSESEASIESQNDTSSSKIKPPKKRKRKRQISEPRASKVSRVAEMKKHQTAKMKRPNNCMDLTKKSSLENNSEIKRNRTSSNISDVSYVNKIVDEINLDNSMKTNENLYGIIVKEYLLAEIPQENGLLPIQESIVKKQLANLKIQIFVWQDLKGTDLNEIITDDDEDLLQLAITHNCSLDIISLLVFKKLNPNCIDAYGNTAIHLAILNDMDEFTLSHLMEHIDLNILLTLNDEGYTPLHLAIRRDSYSLAECILNAMDKRLSKDIFYKRTVDELETDEGVKKSNFLRYYENVCLQMDGDDETIRRRTIKNHDMKQKLLQVPDMRSGNIALFFAIENQAEHLVYFLLAHLTDPRTENLAGQDCKTFFSEFGKTLKLSLNIDNAMEKVIKLLS